MQNNIYQRTGFSGKTFCPNLAVFGTLLCLWQQFLFLWFNKNFELSTVLLKLSIFMHFSISMVRNSSDESDSIEPSSISITIPGKLSRTGSDNCGCIQTHNCGCTQECTTAIIRNNKYPIYRRIYLYTIFRVEYIWFGRAFNVGHYGQCFVLDEL